MLQVLSLSFFASIVTAEITHQLPLRPKHGVGPKGPYGPPHPYGPILKPYGPKPYTPAPYHAPTVQALCKRIFPMFPFSKVPAIPIKSKTIFVGM